VKNFEFHHAVESLKKGNRPFYFPGIATPKHEIDLIHERLKLAQSDHAIRMKEQ
jgi:hypothetical protein